ESHLPAPSATHRPTASVVFTLSLHDALPIYYFESSRRATLAQRAYAQANPAGWTGYGPDVWGLTACDGPVDAAAGIDGRRREFQDRKSTRLNSSPWPSRMPPSA